MSQEQDPLDIAMCDMSAFIVGIKERAAREVLTSMLPRNRFSVVAADEVYFINERMEWPNDGLSLRWVADGAGVSGARLLA